MLALDAPNRSLNGRARFEPSGWVFDEENVTLLVRGPHVGGGHFTLE